MKLLYGEIAGRLVSERIAAAVADATTLEAIPSDRRVDGMVALKLDDGTPWYFSASSSAGASGTVLVPASGTGRWLSLVSGTTAALSTATPANVGATGAAGSAATAAKGDHIHADPMRGAAGTALTDTSTQSIQISGGNWRELGTISQDSTLTLAATGAVTGDQIDITRTDATSAHTYTIKDDAAATLFVMPVSKIAWARFQFTGTHFVLRSFGQQ